ncbi:hypothetical protein MN116_000492 [Schistosoma mekongi]|uniref:ZSWIM1/3 RNaseH-like domain-containing protein n=1 Tax=Schistosoma mekongi TaxID=38744 RepID=A0AAE1ZE40_SCHME|nr:hypothetical protein MN116_000492 [Schistosoma mekongi]
MSYVVFFMKTYRWPLYHFVITDGFGRGRTVLFALMRTEKRTDIKQILQSFKNIMGDTSKTTTFTVDCAPGQLRALNEEFPRASIILCLFHVCQSFRKKVSLLYEQKLPFSFQTHLSKNGCIEWHIRVVMPRMLLNVKLLSGFWHCVRIIDLIDRASGAYICSYCLSPRS